MRKILAILPPLLASMVGPTTAAEPAPWTKETLVYKTVGPTRIEADVYRRHGTESRPAMVWIHGGALIMGNRDNVPRDLVELCRADNYVLISLDYRLAPEVKLPEIIDDLKDAFAWIHSYGHEHLHIDPKRVAVTGASAGGYLTMMTGLCVKPRPAALVSYWGYGDVDGRWYTEPSAHYRRQPLVTKREAASVVGGPPTTRSDGRPRFRYYLYLRQNGLWTHEVTGFDPHTERDKLTPFCPVRNVTPDYPPMLMIHGTADADVPYQKSVDMAEALKRQGVTHELVSVENGGHGLGNADPRTVARAYAQARAFIRKHLN